MIKPIQIALAPTRNRPLNMFLGVVLALVSLLFLLSLATYHATDPSLNTSSDPAIPATIHNWIGPIGAYTGDLLLQIFGFTAFFLPILLATIAWGWMRSRYAGAAWLRGTGAFLSFLFVPAVFALLPWHWNWLHIVPIEGVIGRLIAGLLVTWLNIQGAWLVAGVLAAAGVYFALSINFRALFQSVEDRWIGLQSLHDRWRNWREDRAERRAEAQWAEDEQNNPGPSQRFFTGAADQADAEVRQPSRLAALFGRRGKQAEIDPVDDIPAFRRVAEASAPPTRSAPQAPASPQRVPEPPIPIESRRTTWDRTAEAAPATAAHPAAPEPAPMRPIPVEARPEASSARAEASLPASAQARLEVRPEPVRTPPPAPAPAPTAAEIAVHERADAEIKHATVAPKNVAGFKLPPSTLLTPGGGPSAVREDELREEAKVLVEKCGEFDVRGQVVQINPGPMVTTYEFKPEAGVKYSRVTGLADDLCLAMRAESILIERMAGKSTVGIQVPNHERETIHLRDVLESETFAKAKSRLTLAMGKDINGRIVTADLASMPHVLIAGSTGSGKSVAINAMIMSLLFRTTPQQVRLILVDPKRVELGMYEGIPHLFTPIITEPKLAANALRNAVREMERRLKLLASRSVRNIDQYNKLFEGVTGSLFDDGEPEEPLPYIVVIIDELADLMMLDRANVEESITRLAQMARAVGIHLVLATQRPSVDVITGLIKANVPTRISFRLSTKVDSRTILDTNGAEALLGRGDMLFLPPGTSRLMRLHAPYVSEKETAAIVKFWKDQGTAEYAEGFLESPKDERTAVEGSSGDEDENDPMFDDAVRLVFEFGKASTSLLQRRLRIGYGRAAHLIDLMERDGLVGPADGSRPRELLKAPGWLHEVTNNE
ncbi:DNA translocase FtsK [Occallatibacter riparius]|uniref:DNA translocase FtsK n=1 Tax=Occallatibacter riparius TaxID=1002689 RepID=A0A9J7BSF2_9BACT|nr:DNA translocase FtsK [Occallatibacter riparius]UWZ83965.1 DNA translocase FtsK [Occallatibacter riparius]